MATKRGEIQPAKNNFQSGKKTDVTPANSTNANTFEEDDDTTEIEGDVLSEIRKIKASADDDEDEVVVDDVEDDVTKADEDENWDPDFDEFDIPKSGAKVGGGKKGKDEDEDFSVDDEFKDLFGNSSPGFDDEEDDF